MYKATRKLSVDAYIVVTSKKTFLVSDIFGLKSVQKLEAHKIFLLGISEISVGLSLNIYHWKALPGQNINM